MTSFGSYSAKENMILFDFRRRIKKWGLFASFRILHFTDLGSIA
jgi:hypothetical protein